MVEVVVTSEFEAWYASLKDDDAEAVSFSVELLEQMGVRLPFPHSSAIKGWDGAFRELRVQAQGRPLRVFYRFDPQRQAVLILGGDKTGDERFYVRMKGAVERLWNEYLAELGTGPGEP
jgi:hypothetical protein